MHFSVIWSISFVIYKTPVVCWETISHVIEDPNQKTDDSQIGIIWEGPTYKETSFRVGDRIVPESRVNKHETVTIPALKGGRVKRSYQNSHSVGEKNTVDCFEKWAVTFWSEDIGSLKRPYKEGVRDINTLTSLSFTLDLLTGHPTSWTQTEARGHGRQYSAHRSAPWGRECGREWKYVQQRALYF